MIMCWETRLEPVLLVAEKDIPVKKILRDTMEPYYHPTLKYEIGKEYYTFMESPYRPLGFHQFMQIGYGFHSYHNMCTLTIEQGLQLCVRFDGHAVCVYPYKNMLIADCVIPKGSTYYLNEFSSKLEFAHKDTKKRVKRKEKNVFLSLLVKVFRL